MSILNHITEVETINCEYLTQLMRTAGYCDATVIDFVQEETGGKSHGGGSISRFKLTYSDNSPNTAPVSVILKESCDIASQVLDPLYAQREVACYRNNIFKDIKDRLYIPKAYHLSYISETSHYWIWMEDLGEATFNIEWSHEILQKMIYAITEFHSKWWGRVEQFKKMSFLRQRAQAMYDGLWVDRITQNCMAIETHPQCEQIEKVFSDKRRKMLVQLSKSGDLVYPKLDALPQTLLHHDIWLPNLGIYNDKTVLIDWSYVGPGTPGADLSQTVALLVQMWNPDIDDEALLYSLWEGLTDGSGLSIEYEDIKAGYELTFCLRPAHALGGPILGSILSGKGSMVGDSSLEGRLASAEATLQRIERGIKRLE